MRDSNDLRIDGTFSCRGVHVNVRRGLKLALQSAYLGSTVDSTTDPSKLVALGSFANTGLVKLTFLVC